MLIYQDLDVFFSNGVIHFFESNSFAHVSPMSPIGLSPAQAGRLPDGVVRVSLARDEWVAQLFLFSGLSPSLRDVSPQTPTIG